MCGSLLFDQELLNVLEFTFVCRACDGLGDVRICGSWESLNHQRLHLVICPKLRLWLVKGRLQLIRVGRNL